MFYWGTVKTVHMNLYVSFVQNKKNINHRDQENTLKIVIFI